MTPETVVGLPVEALQSAFSPDSLELGDLHLADIFDRELSRHGGQKVMG